MLDITAKSLKLSIIALISTLSVSCSNNSAPSQSSKAKVITLTQTGCQFLETESQDYQFTPTKAEDCNQINQETLTERKSAFKPLSLSAGEYIFEVTNQDVPYGLGFYLRGQDINRVTLPSVSGGGLQKGITKEYRVTLRPGKYWISCPLNPTPDYPLIVN